MDLSKYLKQQMEQKKLTALDVERRSGNKVTDTHVAYILQGKAQNPTLRIIIGLAQALEVEPEEIFRTAINRATEQLTTDSWTARGLLDAMERVMDSSELTRLLKLLLEQKPAKIRAMLKELEK